MLSLVKVIFMDMQAEKYSLIEYITQVKDIRVIEKIRDFVKANERDFWDDLTENQKQEIRQGMDEWIKVKSSITKSDD